MLKLGQLSLYAVLAVIIGSSTDAVHATTIYAERNAFISHVGATINDDYTNPGYRGFDTPKKGLSDAEMSSVLTETKYSTTGRPNGNIVSAAYLDQTYIGMYYCGGCNGSYVLDFTSTSFSSQSGVYAVGFDFFNIINAWPGFTGYHAYITFGDGSHRDIALESADYNALITDKFFGIVSDLGIRTIALGLENGGVTDSGSFGHTNLLVGDKESGNVSEPSSVALMGLAAWGLIFSRRCRR